MSERNNTGVDPTIFDKIGLKGNLLMFKRPKNEAQKKFKQLKRIPGKLSLPHYAVLVQRI